MFFFFCPVAPSSCSDVKCVEEQPLLEGAVYVPVIKQVLLEDTKH